MPGDFFRAGFPWSKGGRALGRTRKRIARKAPKAGGNLASGVAYYCVISETRTVAVDAVPANRSPQTISLLIREILAKLGLFDVHLCRMFSNIRVIRVFCVFAVTP